MACTPLNVQPGLFANVAWGNAPSQSFDGKTVTLTPGGANPGLAVAQGANSRFFPLLANRTQRYMVLGGKYLLVLDTETGLGPSTRIVTLVDFTTWSDVAILTVLASANAVALPVVQVSQGNAAAFLAHGQDGTQHTSVAIHRSDNGQTLGALGFPIVPTGETRGSATATQLIIHYTTSTGSTDVPFPLPAGKSAVTPASQSFADAFVGGCPTTPQTKQFVIKNVGDDCLTVVSIGNSAPFAVQATSKPLPATLAKNETMSVTVAFAPTATGSWPAAALPLGLTPANGDVKLTCAGKALSAVGKLSFSATTLNFGKVPLGTPPATQTVTVTNTGSRPVAVSVAPLNASGFACAGYNGTLNCGQSQPLGVSFAPLAEGPQTASLIVSSDAPDSPTTITLLGAGCVANALISVPPTAPIGFGEVQRGFRTVRLFEVQNTGDGPLTFSGALSGPDAALFGLPDPQGSVTNAPTTRAYSVAPVSPCGTGVSGSGSTIVAISFFADAAPALASATLTLSAHNATNFPATQTWAFPLAAVIVPPVALDVALVVDHSASMADTLGARVKLDAAVSATQLLVELLRPDVGDRVALVRFNHAPEVLVAMTPVTSAAAPTQATIRGQVQTDVPPATGATAIAGGALTGIAELQKPRPPVPALTRALVVLTDGIENTAFEDPAGSGDWFSILGTPQLRPPPASGTVGTTSMPRPADLRIYAIGLGKPPDGIDAHQLTVLAGTVDRFLNVDQDLTGLAYFQLEKYYTQIFMDMMGTAPVHDPMYWISPGERHEIEFDVLRGDVDALVVVNDFEGLRLPFFCLSPTGELIDPALVPAGYQLRSGATPQARFVEFRMPLGEPDRYAGRWKVVVEHRGRVCQGMPDPDAREPGFLPKRCKGYKQPIPYGIAIGVGSNFRMTPLVTPGPVTVGTPILLTTLVSEAGLPVAGCDVEVEARAPDGATWSFALLDDGAHADGDADDGEYARSFPHTTVAGTYHFRFTATGTSRDGEPVVRQAFRDKPVFDATPPGGGGDDDCCEKLLAAVEEQGRLLERLLRSR